MMVVDVATIAVSGLFCYYSAVVTAPVSAAIVVVAITTDADANYTCKKGCESTLFSIHLPKRHPSA